MAFKEVRKRSNIFRPWSSGLRAIQAKPPVDPRKSVAENGHLATQGVRDELSSTELPGFTGMPVPRASNRNAYPPQLPGASFAGCEGTINGMVSRQNAVASLAALEANAIMNRWSTKGTKKQRPKRFQCPHCQVSFSNNGQLKGHIRIHTGERPFACDHADCGKTFTRNEELTRHKRIHTGVRPFPCPLCGKKFGRKDHLKKHVKTHQRPPPIQLTSPVAFSSLPPSAMMPPYCMPLSELFWAGIF